MLDTLGRTGLVFVRIICRSLLAIGIGGGGPVVVGGPFVTNGDV